MTDGPNPLIGRGTLVSHLLELRNRVIRSLLAIGLVFLPCAYFQQELFQFVAEPLLHKLPEGGQLIATGVASPFTTPFKLSFFVALFVAMPYVLYQLWSFVAQGLYRHEKRFAIPLLVSSIVLFYVGVAFAYAFVFPVMFQFFASTAPRTVVMMTDISIYLGFVLTMCLAFGVAFELPVAVVLLVVSGILSLERLKRSRAFVLIGIFVIAAILTPPDAVSQCLLAIPMYLLFEGGVVMARILARRRIAPDPH